MASSLGIILVFAVVTVVVLAGYFAFASIVRPHGPAAGPPPEGKPPTEDSVLVERYLANRPPEDWAGRMDTAFNRLIHHTLLEMSPEQALGFVCLLGVVGASALYLWKGEIWVSLIGMVIGMSIPLVIYFLLKDRWHLRLLDQLPDACFLMARSLRAGLSISQAVDTMATYGPKPLAEEFRRVGDNLEMGLPPAAAFQIMANRIQLADFDALAACLQLHKSVGGNLPVLLDQLAASTRDRNLFRGYIRSVTALGRITATFMAMSVPVILLGYAILQPSYFDNFFKTTAGLIALITALVLDVIGTIWIYRLLKIDY